jgi:hypothetical protein
MVWYDTLFAFYMVWYQFNMKHSCIVVRQVYGDIIHEEIGDVMGIS